MTILPPSYADDAAFWIPVLAFGFVVLCAVLAGVSLAAQEVRNWRARWAARDAETQAALDLSRFDAGKFDRQNAALREWARTGRVS